MRKKQKREGRTFMILRASRDGKIIVTAEPPTIRSRPAGKASVSVVEIPLCSPDSGISFEPLAELLVSNKLSLDETLELLKRAPRIHSADTASPKQSCAPEDVNSNKAKVSA